MSNWTYEFPDPKKFLEALRHSLQADGEQDLADQLLDATCDFRDTGQYSSRPNAYWATVYLRVPADVVPELSEKEEKLKTHAEPLLPSQTGYDVREVQISPTLGGDNELETEPIADRLLQVLVRRLTRQGNQGIARVLARSKAERLIDKSDRPFGSKHFLKLLLPPDVADRLAEKGDSLEERFADLIESDWRRYIRQDSEWKDTAAFGGVVIEPDLSQHEPEWREAALEFLDERDFSNQGRAHSKNIAGVEEEGLLFRSQPEVHVYHALKQTELPFAPLPVFVRGGENFDRLEPDFVILYRGAFAVLEIDGDFYHTESPVDADERVGVLRNQGCFVFRVRARRCNTREKAEEYVKTELLPKLKKRLEAK